MVTIRTLDDQRKDRSVNYTCTRRLWLDRTQERVVEDGDPAAAVLLCAPGRTVPAAVAARYRLAELDALDADAFAATIIAGIREAVNTGMTDALQRVNDLEIPTRPTGEFETKGELPAHHGDEPPYSEWTVAGLKQRAGEWSLDVAKRARKADLVALLDAEAARRATIDAPAIDPVATPPDAE